MTAPSAEVEERPIRLFIVGANGRTGREVVAKALEAGAMVTAFVRRSSSLSDHSQLTVIHGDVTGDTDALAAALGGHDVVISTLGNPLWLKGLKGPAIIELSFRNLVSAMSKAGVSRILAILSWGTGASRQPAGFLVRMIADTLIRPDCRDFTAGEEALIASGLDWTIAYFGALSDGPATHGWSASPIIKTPTRLAIARGDVAQFLIEATLQEKFLRSHVVLNGAKAGR